MSHSSTHQTPFDRRRRERLLVQCIRALDQDDEAALRRILRDHPRVAPILVQRLTALATLGLLSDPGRGAAPARGETPVPPA